VGGRGGREYRPIGGVECPRFRFLVPGSWGVTARYYDSASSRFPSEIRLDFDPVLISTADRIVGEVTLGAAPVCSWVFSGCGFRLNFSLALAWRWNTLYLLIYVTVDKFSAITSCGDSGSFLLHPAAFNPLRALSQFSLTPSNSHTSAFSRLHLLSFDIHAQNTPRGCIARPSQLAGRIQLTPWFPVHTQKKGLWVELL
jgi:hypothetical protein